MSYPTYETLLFLKIAPDYTNTIIIEQPIPRTPNVIQCMLNFD